MSDRSISRNDELERRFDGAMMEIYERAGREVGYWATRYLQMLRRKGGLATARHFLRSKAESEGYVKLREAGRLDLTVEALVQQPEWAQLFTEGELEQARARYREFGEMPLPKHLQPSGELVALVDRANAAPPNSRVAEYRGPIAAHGAAAVTMMVKSVERGGSVGLAVAVLEAVARAEPDRAKSGLWAIRRLQPAWSEQIEEAISRIKVKRRAGPPAAGLET
jgi:hypothetical protein